MDGRMKQTDHLFCSSVVAAVVAILWATVASDSVTFASWAASRTS